MAARYDFLRFLKALVLIVEWFLKWNAMRMSCQRRFQLRKGIWLAFETRRDIQNLGRLLDVTPHPNPNNPNQYFGPHPTFTPTGLNCWSNSSRSLLQFDTLNFFSLADCWSLPMAQSWRSEQQPRGRCWHIHTYLHSQAIRHMHIWSPTTAHGLAGELWLKVL